MNSWYQYHNTNCFWCNKDMNQRNDTYQRQLLKYGHNCCRKCFGLEPLFKNRRKDVMISNNPFKNKTHNKETRRILSMKAMGRPAWNKGIGKYTKRNIKLSQWKVLRTGLLERDCCQCWKCNNRFDHKYLHIHHLLSVKRFQEHRLDFDNCVLLCESCHKEFHKIYGKLKFTPNDFVNWINASRDFSNQLQLC